MSSSPTAPTSTTVSSSSCGSPRAEAPAPPRVAVIACGALGGHVRAIAGRRGWPVEVHTLPALLHNRPERIAAAAAAMFGLPLTVLDVGAGGLERELELLIGEDAEAP